METSLLLKKLGRMFPKRIAKQYHDYVGLMLGKLPKEVKSVLLCLDYDEFVFAKIQNEKLKPDLIIAHHPFIYGTKKDVFLHDPKKKELYEASEKAGLCVYSIHTNFDQGRGGMNDTLALKLKLQNIQPLVNEPMARGGFLEEALDAEQFVRYVKEHLKVKTVRFIRGNNQLMKRVALIGGSGAGYFRIAQDEGYDVFISGDVRHNVRRDVLRYQFNYLDVPHEVERVFMIRMAEILTDFDPNIQIIIVDHEEEAIFA